MTKAQIIAKNAILKNNHELAKKVLTQQSREALAPQDATRSLKNIQDELTMIVKARSALADAMAEIQLQLGSLGNTLNNKDLLKIANRLESEAQDINMAIESFRTDATMAIRKLNL